MSRRRIVHTMPKYLTGILLVAIFALCVSCDNSFSEPETNGREDCRLIVSLTAPSVVLNKSKSVNTEPIFSISDNSPAEVNETKIRNLSLFLVTDEDKVYPLVSKYINLTGENYQYEATLNVDADYVIYKPEENKYYLTARLVAVANMPENPDPRPFENFPISIEEMAQSGVIPMWGVTGLENLQLTVGEKIDCGTNIRMLRSLPKFTFTLAEEFRDRYRISRIETPFADFNKYFICDPKAGKSVWATGALTETGTFNPVSDDSGKGFPICLYNNDRTVATLYTGERECDFFSGLPLWYDLTLESIDGTDSSITGRIYLCDYVGGRPDFSSGFTRLVRNHDYSYVISLAQLELLVSFEEWTFGGKVHVELE